MREDFRVGVGLKVVVAILDELFLERLIVFNYPVVNQRDLASGIKMRVGIVVSNFSMGCPAGVANSIGTSCRLLVDQLRQGSDPARTLAGLDVIAIYDSNPRRIVPAIFQTAQPVEQDGCCLRPADVTNDSAHNEGWE